MGAGLCFRGFYGADVVGGAQYGESPCLSFGGWRVEAAVSQEVLQAVSGPALQAAWEAAEQIQQKRQDLRQAIELELEQAGYEARWAARRYESVDPEQPWVAARIECGFRDGRVSRVSNQCFQRDSEV